MMNMLLYFLQDTPIFFNQVVDVSTVVIALCSLFVSGLAVYFTYTGLKYSREHNKKSVQPLLELTCDYHQYDEPYVHFYLVNKGSGVGIVEQLEVILVGEKIDWSKPSVINTSLEKHIASKQKLDGEQTEVIKSFQHFNKNKQAVSVDEESLILKFEHEDISLIKDLMYNIRIICKYRSLYDQEFYTDIDTQFEIFKKE